MYAIVEIAGQQFKVQKDQQIFVHRLDAKEGSKVEFDDVYLIDDNGKISVGAPAVEGALVTAKVLEHLKGDKVIVFKKKRRKGYKKKNGHRQYLTKLQIEAIAASGAKKSAVKAEPKAKAEKVETEVKEVKAEAKPKAAKAEAKPKTTTKKTTTKKVEKKSEE